MPRRRKDPILYYETRYGKRSKSSCTKSLPLLASPKLTEKAPKCNSRPND
ncbi:unnamed protein product [Nesidiocoris tenuis]|uniref:Uncharacterized protein n=1 Tax=Nesidiocoris tenuis TaxID=355587 RepID=A0A6H5GAI3_9HEMI|nr:unnamed protein product [Nesidiocoris tenuis]